MKVERSDVSFESGGTRCAAWLFTPPGEGPHPCVVLGHFVDQVVFLSTHLLGRPRLGPRPASALSRETQRTLTGTGVSDVFRTPDDRFADLPGFPYEPHYRDWEGLRLAHIDEGEGPLVLMCHGEPSWSFLYRKLMPPLLEAGFRCIVPDQPGFGRSDKPTDIGWYSYDRHTAALAALVEELDLDDVTLVCQDWGGPIGLRVAALEAPQRFARVVAMDTGLFTGHQQMGEAWHRFRDFVERTEDLPVGMLCERSCKTPPSPAVVAGYEAPFPTVESKAGARAFPLFLPLTPESPGAEAGTETAKALFANPPETLLLWADSDPALPLEPVGRLVQSLFPRAEPLTVIEDAGHFLQEDKGEEIGALIVDWLPRG